MHGHCKVWGRDMDDTTTRPSPAPRVCPAQATRGCCQHSSTAPGHSRQSNVRARPPVPGCALRAIHRGWRLTVLGRIEIGASHPLTHLGCSYQAGVRRRSVTCSVLLTVAVLYACSRTRTVCPRASLSRTCLSCQLATFRSSGRSLDCAPPQAALPSSAWSRGQPTETAASKSAAVITQSASPLLSTRRVHSHTSAAQTDNSGKTTQSGHSSALWDSNSDLEKVGGASHRGSRVASRGKTGWGRAAAAPRPLYPRVVSVYLPPVRACSGRLPCSARTLEPALRSALDQ